ncbi:HNH endonuclease [Salmonella enterica]|nr:HNH endonuclease [Salmonella enterica]
MNWCDYFVYDEGKLYWRINSGKARVMTFAGWHDKGGYLRVRLNGRTHGVHRIVWEMHHGKIQDGMEIDHNNGIRDDNRIENLNLVTSQENNKNMKIPSHNKSGVIGVSFCKRTGKWFASIRVNKKEVFLGRYSDINDAAKARKDAEIKFCFNSNHGRNL